MEEDIVVRADAMLVVATDGEAAAATEEELTLAEEASLLVFVIRRVGVGRRIGKAVGRPALDVDEGALAALDVDSGTACAGYVYATERELKLLFAVNLERAVGCLAAQDILNGLGGRGDSDVGAIGSDLDAVSLARDGGRRAVVRDVYSAGESRVLDEVVGVVIFGRRIGHVGVVGLGEHVPSDVEIERCA